ncbi:MAG TPA: hypothetical protein VF319_14520 [Caldimonas sp.]
MKRRHAATVITQAGRVVGVQIDSTEPAAHDGPVARLVAGPGQQAHRLDLELPSKLKTAKAIERFHAAVERTIGFATE